jgi:hypothetical protein
MRLYLNQGNQKMNILNINALRPATVTSMNRREFIGACAVLTAGSAFGVSTESKSGFQAAMKSKPVSKRLFAFRLEELSAEQRELELTVTCLQGLVNRRRPEFYLVQDQYDLMWLDWLRERGDVKEVVWLNLEQIWNRFLFAARCMFITDPAIPGSVNVATMLAGVYEGLVVTPANASRFKLPVGTGQASSKDGRDLRSLNWKKDVEAYRWALAEIGDQLSRKAVAYTDPQKHPNRDYFVEFKVPVVWICHEKAAHKFPYSSFDEEKAFVKDLFLKWPANIPCMGWPGDDMWGGADNGIGEWPGVRLASQCGKYEICTGHDAGAPAAGNMSVHSGTRGTFRQTIPPITLQPDKVYYSFVRSDGDGMNFLRFWYRKLFNEPSHGRVPMGWQIGTSATDLMPDILDYYYKHATPNECFVNALTGVGYIWEDNFTEFLPADQQKQVWDDYLRYSAEYRARLDATVMSTIFEMSPDRLARFAGMPGLNGIFANYGRMAGTTLENEVFVSAGKPVFRAVNAAPPGDVTTPDGCRKAADFMIKDIREWTPKNRPAFLHIFLGNWLKTLGALELVVKDLGPEFVCVRPDQLAVLYQESHHG